MDEISSEELTEWMIYYSFEPWGEERADYRNGITASLIANVNRKKDSKVFKPEDFIPKFEPQQNKVERIQTWQEQLAIVEILNFAFGGEDKRKR